MKKRLIFLIACFALTACGVKPSSVTKPDSAQETNFPQTYPRGH